MSNENSTQGASAETRPRELWVKFFADPAAKNVDQLEMSKPKFPDGWIHMVEAPTRTLSMDKPLFDGADIMRLNHLAKEFPQYEQSTRWKRLKPLIDWALEVQPVTWRHGVGDEKGSDRG